MEAKMDLTMFKEIPGYKAILKAVLKAQMQMLVEQLSEVEEESVILTASLSDGTLSHLGSLSGKNFLEGREEIKSQFLFHCLKKRTSTPMPSQDPLYIAGRSGTSLPNQEPVFIPGRTSMAVPGQEPVFIPDIEPQEVMQQQHERPAKKPRRTLPEVPTLFGRGRGSLRGAPFGEGQGMGIPRGGPFGRGIVLGRGAAGGRGGPVGRGLAVGRGNPSGRGAGSGRARRPRGQFPTRGRGRGVKRPNSGATATVTSPYQSSVSETGQHDFTTIQETNKTEPDLVTVKAENFEVSIDLNSPVAKPIDTPVNIDMSPSVKLKRLPSNSGKKTSTPKKSTSDTSQSHGIDDKGDTDHAIDEHDTGGHDTGGHDIGGFDDSTDDDNDGNEAGLDNNTRDDSVDNSLNVSHVSVKQEVPDVEELLGMEAGALREMYGVPGPSGDLGNQSWGIMESGAMGSDSFGDGTPGPSQEGSQTSSSSVAIPPVYQYLDPFGNLKIPQTGPNRKKCAVKRKLCQKTIEEKYVTILELEKGELSKSEIAKTHNIALSTLSGWIKDSESIKAAYGKFGPGRCTRRKGNYQELEDELLKWCKNMFDKSIQLSGPIVLERAQQLVIQLEIKDCKLSSGWLERFKERHGIKFKKPQGSSSVLSHKIPEPAGNTPKPVHNTQEPVNNTSEPAHNASEPVNNTSEPAHNASEPVNNTSEPAHNASEPVNNTSEPAHNASEPIHNNAPDNNTPDSIHYALEPVPCTSLDHNPPELVGTCNAPEPVHYAPEPASNALEPASNALEPSTAILHHDLD